MATELPAGWYADPADTSRYRYWGGVSWTTHTLDRAAVDLTADPALRPLPDFDATDTQGAPTQGTTNRRRIPVLIGALALVAVLAIAGVTVFGGGSGDEGHRLHGSISVAVSLVRGGAQSGGANCGGSGRQGIGAGTTLTVTSGKGEELGTIELGEGHLDQTRTLSTCVFEYAIDGLPDAGMYVVSVGQQRVARAPLDRLEATGWRLDGRLR